MPIVRLTELPVGFEALVLESEREGFEFVRRLEQEWQSGQNRFDRPGESLLGIVHGERLDGVGGINRDPYLDDPRVGRLRHVYVAPTARNSGLGSQLVRAILDTSLGHFELVRLRAATARTDGFYARLGFEKLSDDKTATHSCRPMALMGAAR
jgi:GNAT superfamily N-acetyltransferase